MILQWQNNQAPLNGGIIRIVFDQAQRPAELVYISDGTVWFRRDLDGCDIAAAQNIAEAFARSLMWLDSLR